MNHKLTQKFIHGMGKYHNQCRDKSIPLFQDSAYQHGMRLMNQELDSLITLDRPYVVREFNRIINKYLRAR